MSAPFGHPLVTPTTLALIAAEFEAVTRTASPANATEAGYWKRIAAAVEVLVSASTSANATTRGYQKRAAAALEDLANAATAANATEDGYASRMVRALEAFGVATTVGSWSQRLYAAVVEYTTTAEAYYTALGSPTFLASSGYEWGGLTWSNVAGGPTYVAGMSHSIKTTSNDSRIRFELQNTSSDRPSGDTDPGRRIEIGTDGTLLSNGVELWGAFSSKDTAWPDPAGQLAIGGLGHPFFQIHFGSGGGSPALAFRRGPDGNLKITTRGDNDLPGTTRYDSALSFDAVHDFVYRLTLSPTAGAVQVWVDGTSLINLTGISMGAAAADHYWRIGLYYAAGIAGTVVNERANIANLSTTSLASRPASPPAWPAGSTVNTGSAAPTISARTTSVSAAADATTWTPTLATHATGDRLAVFVAFDSVAGTPSSITTGTAGWTRLTHTTDATGNNGGALFYYGSGGVFTQAPSGATPAPLITCSVAQQFSAVAFTSTDATNIEATTSSGNGANGNPPAITPSGGLREYRIVAMMSQDGTAGITGGPSKFTDTTICASSGTGGAASATADRAFVGTTYNPSAFLSASEQHTTLTAALWK